MSQELIRIVDNIARDKNIDRESIFVDLEEAIVSAARKHFGDMESNIVVNIDRATGAIVAFKDNVQIDMRRLGRIRLLDDPENEPPISELGVDPLLEQLDAEQIHGILRKRSAAIKAVLLDQSVFAGVGNWIADEVLYQARIRPQRPARRLSAEAVRRLCRCLGRIVARAVAVDADSARYPSGWLFHYRWDKDQQPVFIGGERIRFDVVAGRTTAWVPGRQR